MKKKTMVRCSVAVAVLAGLLWLNQAVLWPFTGVRLAYNSEYVRVIHWTDGGYDSWGLDYSHGHQFDGTRWRNLWHWPTWHRTRFRSKSNNSITGAVARTVNALVGLLGQPVRKGNSEDQVQ